VELVEKEYLLVASDHGVAGAGVDHNAAHASELPERAAQVAPPLVVYAAGIVVCWMNLRASELADLGIEKETAQFKFVFLFHDDFFEPR
jgi:hypothetical protein